MLKDMTIKSRLILVIGLLSLLLISVGGLGMYGTNQANIALKSVYEDRMIPAVQLGKILDVWYQVRKNAIDAAESKDIIVARKLTEEANKLVKQNEGIWAQYLATNLIPEEVALTKTKGEQHVQYVQSMNQTFQLAMAGEFEAAVQNVKTDTAKKFSALRDTVFTLLELQGSAVAKEYALAQSHYERNFIITSVMITIGVFLAMIIGFLLVRAIVNPLNEAITVANAVASGDLTSRIEVNSTNETGRLLQALKTMNENLLDLVNKVRISADQIETASGEIATGNSDLSQRTEEQASSLEETASSMEELTSTVKQNADNARQANQLASGASEIAAKGGIVVGQVVETMSSINESSKKIVDIISVIDGIAFQTNILALNAAVEAARAGEQGRGFAVVATEVRTLAQRSAAAAKEIKELINDSVNKVEDGTRLVDEAGSTMNEIVIAVKRVTDIMNEISAASQEQSSGIEQINQAVTQMDEATQQNAALVEQASAAAESMQEQTQALTQAVTRFKLSGGSHVGSAPVRRNNRASTIAKLPNRGPAAKKPVANPSAAITSPQPRKVAAGGGDDWEEF